MTSWRGRGRRRFFSACGLHCNWVLGIAGPSFIIQEARGWSRGRQWWRKGTAGSFGPAALRNDITSLMGEERER
jgi:hypothetical protein